MVEEFKVIINNPNARHEAEQQHKSYSVGESWGLCRIGNGESVLYRLSKIRASTAEGTERETLAIFPSGIFARRIGSDGNPYVTKIDKAEQGKVAENLRQFLRLEEDVPINFA
jgi:hypothetical protein